MGNQGSKAITASSAAMPGAEPLEEAVEGKAQQPILAWNNMHTLHNGRMNENARSVSPSGPSSNMSSRQAWATQSIYVSSRFKLPSRESAAVFKWLTKLCTRRQLLASR